MVEFITENEVFDYQAFSDDIEIQRIARESIEHVSKLYPIYVMMYYHNGESLTPKQTEYLDLLSDLVSYYQADVTLVVNEQDIQTFRDYDEDNCFKFLVHSCYDSNNELSNNVSKIKNFILKSAASRFGNKNINWVFLIDEGIEFLRFNQGKYMPCNNRAQEVILSLAIWQYLTTKKVCSYIRDENGIGLTGIFDSKNRYQEFAIDNQLLSSAMLINLSECNRKHIEFDLMNDVLEDIDFNVNMFANGLHVVGISWPLNIRNTTEEYRSSRKISNLTLNLWAKWGDRIIKSLAISNNQVVPIFESDFSRIIEEFNASSRHRISWPKNEILMISYLEQKKKLHQN